MIFFFSPLQNNHILLIVSEKVLSGQGGCPDPGRGQSFRFKFLGAWDLVHLLGLPEGSEASRWFFCAHQEALLIEQGLGDLVSTNPDPPPPL